MSILDHNQTGQDFAARDHFRYAGPPIVDIHAHVMLTAPSDPGDGPPVFAGPAGSVAAAELLVQAADEFNVGRIVAMTPADEIAPLRARFGDRIGFNGMINKKPDEPDDAARELTDAFLAAGVEMIKFWAAPRGRDRGLTVDAPWRIKAAEQAVAAGVKTIMVHVGDPDRWWQKQYLDVAKFGTKSQQYEPFRGLLERFPEVTWIGAHLGGDPEHPDHLDALLEAYPHLLLDTSATKWQVREVSPRAAAFRDLVTRRPERFLFGSDLVTRHPLPLDHYRSRFWCQRTLWESDWRGPSPIGDPDHPDGPVELVGVGLPADVVAKVYVENATRLLGR